MKREKLLKHLRLYGCVLKREGGRHSLWLNPKTGIVEAVPRHAEIPDLPVKKIPEFKEQVQLFLRHSDRLTMERRARAQRGHALWAEKLA